ncbi:hypothetical protein D2E22_0950 [Bifidobacterium castoris]|uniref:Uncharacterized protein n=1 Tax=Bifidobacterium castoris TaxID=2306972 RepID=A0A430F7K4_9BIFI|nr:hypothetical protein D2E22_0950 [Bifidobacterium castoris]
MSDGGAESVRRGMAETWRQAMDAKNEWTGNEQENEGGTHHRVRPSLCVAPEADAIT